jgi:hypothetical protein
MINSVEVHKRAVSARYFIVCRESVKRLAELVVAKVSVNILAKLLK